jgi:hypothetical protein
MASLGGLEIQTIASPTVFRFPEKTDLEVFPLASGTTAA